MSLDRTSFEAALKVRYGIQELKKLGFVNRPLWAMMPKMEKLGGRNFPLPLHYGNTQNIGSSFLAASRGNSGDPATHSSVLTEFVLTTKKKYGNAFLDRETMMASRGDINSFASAAVHELDSTVEAFADALHIDLYGDGTGSKGEVVSVVDGANPVVTFTPAVVTRLNVGEAVVFSSTTTKTSALASEIVTITAIDRSAGSITLSGTVTGVTAAAGAGKWIFRYGDRIAGAISGVSDYLTSPGLDGWFPETAPTSGDSWYGVDRSTDTVRLAGNRIAWAGNFRKTIMAAAIECGRQGAGANKVLFINHTDMQNLLFEYEGKLEHRTENAPGEFGVGFKAYMVSTPEGDVKVIADRQCPEGVGYLLDMSCVKVYSIDAAPHMVADAGKYLRSHTADSLQVEFAAYWVFGCSAPGKCARLDLTA